MERLKKEQAAQAQGRFRGGLSTKIHAAVDALGNPVCLILTEGQASDYTKTDDLIAGFSADYVIADKGYDSDTFVMSVQNVALKRSSHHAASVRNCGITTKFYKERNLVERYFQKLKHYRRIATRYERLARNYTAMLTLVSIVIWLV